MPNLSNKYDELRQEVRFRGRIIFILFALLFFLGYAYLKIPDTLKVYIPPDLARPNVIENGVVYPSYVYAFARLVLEGINYCPKDCGSDYVKNLDQYRELITSSCYEELRLHVDRHPSIYNFRTRKMLPYGSSEKTNVDEVAKNVWTANVQSYLEEHVAGTMTRFNPYSYPMRIIYSNLPIDKNPYQLLFDCFVGDGPQPIAEAGVNSAN